MAKKKQPTTSDVEIDAPRTAVTVDFPRIQPLAKCARLADIVTTAFEARSKGFVLGINPSTIDISVRNRTQIVAHVKEQNALIVSAEFEVAVKHGGVQICRTAGSFGLMYDFAVPADDTLDEGALPMFAAINGTYHAWPYIREAVQTHLTRLGLPGVVLPVWQPPAELPEDGWCELHRKASVGEPGAESE